MPKVTFILKDGTSRVIDADENQSIMQIAVDHEIAGIVGMCGGSMACATCHVYVHPDWEDRVTAEDNEQSEEEEDMLDMAFDVEDNSRLGCQIKVANALDGLIVSIP